MAEKSTFVKIDRNMVSWRWFQTPNTAHLFLYLVIRANIKDGAFKKITVKRGQLVTSLPHLSRDTGLTIRQVRTALEHLISTGEIAEETGHGYRLITLLNYDRYQAQRQEERQANDRQTTDDLTDERHRSKNIRRERIKEEKNVCVDTRPPARPEVTAYFAGLGRSEEDAGKFYAYNEARGWRIGRAPIADWQSVADLWIGSAPDTSTARVPNEETDAFGHPIRKEFEDA